jgi:uncharacterized membrane protein
MSSTGWATRTDFASGASAWGGTRSTPISCSADATPLGRDRPSRPGVETEPDSLPGRYAPPMSFQNWVELAGRVIDAAGVAAVVVGTFAATIYALIRFVRRQRPIYRPYRQFLGRSILLGLELLVAADIIRTVAVTPTLESVAVLAVIVLIRTFLSFSLELEITGRWPWQKQAVPPAADPADATTPHPPNGTSPGTTAA